MKNMFEGKQSATGEIIKLVREKEKCNEKDEDTLEMEEREIFQGRFFMCLPKSFREMDGKPVEGKYSEMLKPELILSSEDGRVNFTFTLDDKEVEEDELEEIRDILVLEILRLYPSYEIETEKIMANDKQIYMFTFEKPVYDGSLYQLIYLLELDHKLLVGGFNCDSRDMEEWDWKVKKMCESIKVYH